MKIKIVLDVELANQALAAMAAHAVDVSKHAKRNPSSPFKWGEYAVELTAQADEFRKALGNAELVTLD